MTFSPLAAYCVCSACSSGVSKRQGPHHVAQALRRMTVPFSLAIVSGLPSRYLAEYGGIGSPTSVRAEGRAGGSFLGGLDGGRGRFGGCLHGLDGMGVVGFLFPG